MIESNTVCPLSVQLNIKEGMSVPCNGTCVYVLYYMDMDTYILIMIRVYWGYKHNLSGNVHVTRSMVCNNDAIVVF